MSDDERAIRQLVATWMEATKAGDADTVLGLMADDVVFLVPGQAPMVGKAAFEAAARAAPAGERPRFEGESEIQEIRVLGDWAYMWTRLTVTVTPPGGAPPFTRAGHTLSVLRKEGGRWLLARDANLLTPVANRAPRG
ncbi:MAG TPA: SgcJ/EcaC family oxidoreductase [Gammaproteobacteria bacterium]